MIKKLFLGVFALAMILAITYMFGPKMEREEITINFPNVPSRVAELDDYINQREDTVKGLKPGNQAYILWVDSLDKRKTQFSIIYIHGFGASPMEGDPVHRFLAEHFGANLFVTRLPEHGIKRENGMEYMSPQLLADAAGEAFQIGKSLGDSVIVVGTSMGGALALLLASQQPEIQSVIVYSPAIRDNGSQLEGLFKPWTQKMMEMAMMENKVVHQNRVGEKAAYWSEDYHINGYRSLAGILYSEMNEQTFKEVTQPVFLGYYYKNDQEQDFVVSVPKMLEMYDQLGTDESKKKLMAFPNAGDHVMTSSITSKDWEGVLFATIDFLENVANVPAKPKYMEMINEMVEAKAAIEKGK